MVGFDDLKGLLQPKWFCDSVQRAGAAWDLAKETAFDADSLS